jgi:hypothetical protein
MNGLGQSECPDGLGTFPSRDYRVPILTTEGVKKNLQNQRMEVSC